MDAFAILYTYYLSINQRGVMKKVFSGNFKEKWVLWLFLFLTLFSPLAFLFIKNNALIDLATIVISLITIYFVKRIDYHLKKEIPHFYERPFGILSLKKLSFSGLKYYLFKKGFKKAIANSSLKNQPPLTIIHEALKFTNIDLSCQPNKSLIENPFILFALGIMATLVIQNFKIIPKEALAFTLSSTIYLGFLAVLGLFSAKSDISKKYEFKRFLMYYLLEQYHSSTLNHQKSEAQEDILFESFLERDGDNFATE